MICVHCGHEWLLRQAHIVKQEQAPEGCRERVQCPACGFEQTVTRPELAECDGD